MTWQAWPALDSMRFCSDHVLPTWPDLEMASDHVLQVTLTQQLDMAEGSIPQLQPIHETSLAPFLLLPPA